jgi:1-deoxy-D-xylulose-5-phosphate reductoisomerase
MRKVSIFGATGSIGQNTIDLIRRRPDHFDVLVLTGGENVELLANDARELGAALAVTANPEKYAELKDRLSGTDVEVAAGAEAISEAAERPADWTMSAIVGAAGLQPGLKTILDGRTLALANKESLVTAGQLLMTTARQHAATMLPVDSEHSAVFQALIGEEIEAVETITITASGGPFRDWPVSRLQRATLQEALNHPNWAMGQRITIDSASMFNKALEIIETREFFGVAPDQVRVIVHPESLVHALVGFRDGALMAHLGAPDMRHAIGFALNWPSRQELPVKRLDLAQIGTLRFEEPDTNRFPALRLAREVMEIGGLSGAVFNAAKEIALDAFIEKRIGFMHMAEVVEEVLNGISGERGLIDAQMTLDTVVQMDHLARIKAREAVERAT